MSPLGSHGWKIVLLNIGTNNLINNDSNKIDENIHETKDEEDDGEFDQEDDEYEYWFTSYEWSLWNILNVKWNTKY